MRVRELEKSSGKKQAGAMVAFTEMVVLEAVGGLHKFCRGRDRVHRPLVMRRWLHGTPRLQDFDLLLYLRHLLGPQWLATDAGILTWEVCKDPGSQAL